MDKIRILIVEDESLVARDIENMAVSQGYEVCGIASTGDQSIEMAYYKSRLGTKLLEREEWLSALLKSRRTASTSPRKHGPDGKAPPTGFEPVLPP